MSSGTGNSSSCLTSNECGFGAGAVTRHRPRLQYGLTVPSALAELRSIFVLTAAHRALSVVCTRDKLQMRCVIRHQGALDCA